VSTSKIELLVIEPSSSSAVRTGSIELLVTQSRCLQSKIPSTFWTSNIDAPYQKPAFCKLSFVILRIDSSFCLITAIITISNSTPPQESLYPRLSWPCDRGRQLLDLLSMPFRRPITLAPRNTYVRRLPSCRSSVHQRFQRCSP